MNPQEFLGKENEKLIKEAINKAEKMTSGEICLHIESSCKENVLDRAAWIFKTLEMHKTAQRNGVLIYLSTDDRKFAIIGDAGINAVVPHGFWDSVKTIMVNHFSASEYAEGLIAGIVMAGEKLKEFFPYQKDDQNELSDEISYGK
jgi:uncharacterized membrane protein